MSEHPQDGPALSLMSRAIYYLDDEAAAFDPVWELPGSEAETFGTLDSMSIGRRASNR